MRLRNYAFVTTAYGLVRSVTYNRERSKQYRNLKTERYETRPMLLVDRIERIISRSLSALIVWPFMLGEDLSRLECLARGRDPQEYGIQRTD